ncbi:kinase-like protein [Suillus decipiens]|nr:kinase-like protein [Suillus decipiens]
MANYNSRIVSFNHSIRVPDLTCFIFRPDLSPPISDGAYGDIYKCVYRGQDGDVKQVAVKSFRPIRGNSKKNHQRELEIWKGLRHPNILKLMGTTRHFGKFPALVSPWMVNGNLTSFLIQNNETLGLRDRLLLLRDIANGLNHLHTFDFGVDGHTCFNPIIHGDLSSNNILIGSNRTAYIADFGLSGTLKPLRDRPYLAKSHHPGALRWAAPEHFSTKKTASAVTTQSDIYSFGSIMFHVLTGNLPWPHLTNDTQICQAVIEGQEHSCPTDGRIPDHYWKFMASCWSNTPIDRPPAEEVLQFIVHELILYDRGSVDGGQHPALVPVSAQDISPVGQSPCSTPSPAPPTTRSSQIYSQLLRPVRLLLRVLLYPLNYFRNQQYGMSER